MRRGVLVGLFFAIVIIPTSTAHATLLHASPSPGVTIPEAPTELTAEFSEPVEPPQTTLVVVNATGDRVDVASTLTTSSTGAAVELRADLPNGTYTARWSALSTVDGHRSSGAWAFAVGAGTIVTPVEIDEPAYPWLSALAKNVVYVGLALLTGFVAFDVWVARRLAPTHWPGHGRSIAVLGAFLHLGGLMLFFVSEARLNDATLVAYGSSTSFGQGLLLRLVLAALLAAALQWGSRLGERPARLVRVAALGAAILAHAYYSHAAALAPARVMGGILDALHLVAALAWSGGLLYVFVSLRTMMGAPDAAEALAELGGRFSRMAQSAIVLLVVTGSAMLVTFFGANVMAWPEELRQTYGLLLAYKIFLALLMMALGAANHFLYVAKYVKKEGAGTVALFRANVRREAVNGILILAIAALLTNLSPALPA